MKLQYNIPTLYKINLSGNINCACHSGNSVFYGYSCKAGPEAAGKGCANGAAAIIECFSGAAAGYKCENGPCFE